MSRKRLIHCTHQPNGDMEWFYGDTLHREDGPAIDHVDGLKVWYFSGKRHREDGPAAEYPNGDKVWCIHGKHHRLDGPAIEFSDGRKEWHYNGEKINCNSQQEFERIIDLKALW